MSVMPPPYWHYRVQGTVGVPANGTIFVPILFNQSNGSKVEMGEGEAGHKTPDDMVT
jgi:hypothetical protein